MDLVVTYGTFDLLHVGHVRLLKRSKALGDTLAVGVSTDAFNAAKGKRTVVPFAERCEMLLELRCVDEVFAEESWAQKRHDLASRGAAALVMGSDWQGKFDDLQDLCRVIYLPRTDLISTTLLRERAVELTVKRGSGSP